MAREKLFAVKLNNISKTFPGVKALSEVSFELAKGEVHALVGENGAGKSTLIKILSGVYKADPGGSVELGWTDKTVTSPADSLKLGISVIYQDVSVFPNLSVAENICIGKAKKFLLNKEKEIELAKKALEVLETDINPSDMVKDLSIGKQQLVAIARAVYFESKFIVMDEPTASLSSGEVAKLYKIVDRLREKGITILYISHKFDEVFRLADRITVLRDGTFVGTYDKNDLTEDALIEKMVGRKLEQREKNSVQIKDEYMLELCDLGLKGEYSNINFKLRKSEVVGITGLVGAGRSELFQSVFGIKPPDSGQIKLEGKEIKISDPSDSIDLGVVYLPENRLIQGIIQKQSMKTNLSSTTIRSLSSKLGFINKKKETELVEQYMESLDIRPRLPEMNIETMSGGNQQKVVVGKWLATHPKVFIVDEPTAGVDIGAKAEIHKLLRTLAAEGLGVIVISSDLPEILQISDRVVVMKSGQMVCEMDINDATQEKIMAKAL